MIWRKRETSERAKILEKEIEEGEEVEGEDAEEEMKEKMDKSKNRRKGQTDE